MIKTEIKVYNREEQREVERKLRETGFQKTADCMWVKIYVKNNQEIIVSKEY